MLDLDGEPFTRGRAKFLDQDPVGGRAEPTAKIFVKISFHGLAPEMVRLAELDTGASWSVLDPETAEMMGALDAGLGERASLSTRFGHIEGELVRVPLTLLADEGEPLDIETTFFVSAQWPRGQIFLGYTSFVDSIRLALDPTANHFYFGPSAGRP